MPPALIPTLLKPETALPCKPEKLKPATSRPSNNLFSSSMSSSTETGQHLPTIFGAMLSSWASVRMHASRNNNNNPHFIQHIERKNSPKSVILLSVHYNHPKE